MPSEGMDSSPSQRLFKRRAKTLVINNAQEKFRTSKQIQSKHHNTEKLNKLGKDDVVRIKRGNYDRTGHWTKGSVIEQIGVRSFDVKTEDGKIFDVIENF